MKSVITGALILFFVSFFSMALAVPAGKNLEFKKSPMGKVTFSGDSHAQKGLKCNACHPDLFSLKKGTAKIQLTDHQDGKKYCFSCHNGESAFGTKDNCNKCHKKESNKK